MTATPNDPTNRDRANETFKRNNAKFHEDLIANISHNLDNKLGLLPNQELPTNPITGKRYTGPNLIALAAQNRSDNRWLTFSQMAAAGGTLNTKEDGTKEQGTKVQFWNTSEKGPDGQIITLDKPKLTYMTLYNVEQTSLTNLNSKTEPKRDPEQFINAFKITHDVDPAARPSYNRETDTIILPPPSRFPSVKDYQRVAVEQIINRQETRYTNTPEPTPGTPEAAAREMKQKLAAAIVGHSLGIGHTSDMSNTIYNNAWKRTAINHPKEITKIAAVAETLAYAATREAQQVQQQQGRTGMDGQTTGEEATRKPAQPLPERLNLHVPYEQKEEAKKVGCRWDKEQKTWYAPAGTDANDVAKWRENRQIQATNPREELMNAMTKMGLIITDNHPIMDGRSHRIACAGDNIEKGEKAGFYVAHSDGVPAGYIKNNRTGESTKWRSSQYTITPEQRETLAQIAKEKYALREEQITKRQEQVSNRIGTTIEKADRATEPVLFMKFKSEDGTEHQVHMEKLSAPTPYMTNKGIGMENNLYKTIDDQGNERLAIPLTDINGKAWSMTLVGDEGDKSYAKNGKKQGSFHVVGGVEKLKDAPVIVLAEGYATAVTLKNGLNTPVVAAMDSGNLLPVAQEMRKNFPEKAIVIAGDDDRHLLDNPQVGKNIGKEKAMEAAQAVGGSAVFPVFPKGADNRLSDFNDLATKTDLGVEGLKQQTQPAIARAITNAKTQITSALIKDAIEQKKEQGTEQGKEQTQQKDKVREKINEEQKELRRTKEEIGTKAKEKDREDKGKSRSKGLSR